MNNIPRHIAVIMDGNGRWAKQRNLPRSAGHRKGVEALRDVVKKASDLSVEVLTVFAFSTENWKRPTEEVGFLMNLLREYIRKELDELHQNNVKIVTIGNLSTLQPGLQEDISAAIKKTKQNSGLIFNIALNYGGKDEIARAVTKMLKEENIEDLSTVDKIQKAMEKYLDTYGLPEPDLLIRTSGEMRISNFLIWQLAYAEFYFTDTLWPDFNGQELVKAIDQYNNRSRRFGGL
ncbi:MAG: isoprenyl transferase [Tindallia sp. MSAO_Bac2]|nr:MAG: isoprenyl transferase [Tindallia sp. MSAO_Bac2]